jgi:hypothetical protein
MVFTKQEVRTTDGDCVVSAVTTNTGRQGLIHGAEVGEAIAPTTFFGVCSSMVQKILELLRHVVLVSDHVACSF